MAQSSQKFDKKLWKAIKTQKNQIISPNSKISPTYQINNNILSNQNQNFYPNQHPTKLQDTQYPLNTIPDDKNNSSKQQPFDSHLRNTGNKQKIMHSPLFKYKLAIQSLKPRISELSLEHKKINEYMKRSFQQFNKLICQLFSNGFKEAICLNQSKTDHNQRQREISEVKQFKQMMIQQLQAKQLDIQQLHNQINQEHKQLTKIKKSTMQLQQENAILYENNFDIEQRVAQIQLQVQQRVRRALEQREKCIEQNNALYVDKEAYRNKIKNLQTKIMILQEKYLQRNQSQIQLNHYKYIEEQLNQRETTLKTQQLKLQQGFKQLQRKQKQLDSLYEQLVVKEQGLRQQGLQLLYNLEEREEKERNVYKVIHKSTSNRGYPSHYHRNHLVEQQLLHQRHTRPIQLYSPSHRGSTATQKPKIRYPSKGLNHSRQDSNRNKQGQDRLYKLGSKLERLRKQIRKQIHNTN